MKKRTIYLRLSITDRCDLRCSYCSPHGRHPAPSRNLLSRDEIKSLVHAFAENGVTKVRITGGEPLLREDIVEIVRDVAGTQGISTVGLTTNGIRLADLARDLAAAGLSAVNVSLDSLDRNVFRCITGRNGMDEVIAGIKASVQAGIGRVKTNTVVMRGSNESELPAIADLAAGMSAEARFIELMPLGFDLQTWRAEHVSAAEIWEILGKPEPVETIPGSSAKMYVRANGSRVGIISPVTNHFCGECNRIRVTCTGRLKPCLRLPVDEDIRPLISSENFSAMLGQVMERLPACKLSGDAVGESVVYERAMSSVGG